MDAWIGELEFRRSWMKLDSWVVYPSDLSDSIRCIHSILDRADSSDLDLFASCRGRFFVDVRRESKNKKNKTCVTCVMQKYRKH